MKFISLLKKIPIDFGQGSLRTKTKGKQIALELAGRGPGRALDVGCRAGDQTQVLKSLDFEVVSIDVECEFDDCISVNADDDLPFPDNTFDLIWCSEVIEHLEDPGRTLGEFRRITKPGGTIVATTPNSYFWLFRIFNLIGISPAKLQHPGHKHFFNTTHMEDLFPAGELYGFFPYMIIKFRIQSFIGPLSPTFVVKEDIPIRPNGDHRK